MVLHRDSAGCVIIKDRASKVLSCLPFSPSRRRQTATNRRLIVINRHQIARAQGIGVDDLLAPGVIGMAPSRATAGELWKQHTPCTRVEECDESEQRPIEGKARDRKQLRGTTCQWERGYKDVASGQSANDQDGCGRRARFSEDHSGLSCDPRRRCKGRDHA